MGLAELILDAQKFMTQELCALVAELIAEVEELVRRG